MTIGTRVAAELGLGLEARVGGGQHELYVVIIDEGHESVVLVNGQNGLSHEIDESSLVSDVVDWGVNSDDNFAQLFTLMINLPKQGIC